MSPSTANIAIGIWSPSLNRLWNSTGKYTRNGAMTTQTISSFSRGLAFGRYFVIPYIANGRRNPKPRIQLKGLGEYDGLWACSAAKIAFCLTCKMGKTKGIATSAETVIFWINGRDVHSPVRKKTGARIIKSNG